MHVKRVIVTVQDEAGQPVPGGRVWLPTADDKAREGKTVGKTGRVQWSDVDFADNPVAAGYEAPPGYELADGPPEIALAQDEEEVTLPFVARAVAAERAAGELEALAPQADVDYGKQPTADQSADMTGQYPVPTGPWNAPARFVEQWAAINNACGLREALQAAAYIFPADETDPCDEQTPTFPDCDEEAQRFQGRMRAHIDQLVAECERIAIKQKELDEFTGYDQAVRRLQVWNTRLGDVMTTYLGLRDLLLLEVESGQIPWQFYNDNRAALDGPVESFHCCQRLTTDFIYQLSLGPVGLCLIDLRAAGDGLVGTLDSLRLDANRRARFGAPAEIRALCDRITVLAHDFEGAQHGLAHFADHYTTGGDARPLAVCLERLIACRDATHGLIGDLRHSLQDRPAPTAWADGPNWIAAVKRGLTGVWNRVTTMISDVRECQALIEQTSFAVVESGATYYQLGAGATENPFDSSGGRGGLETGGNGHTTWPPVFGGLLPGGAPTPAGGFNNRGQQINLNLTGPALTDMSDSLSDIATFTPTVNDSWGGGGYGGGNGGDGGFYGRRIAQVYASVTGQPLPRDPNAFWNTLRATFPADPLTGEIVAEPVRSVVSLYNDTGPLSSVQATLRQFVGLLTPDAHKLLNGLHSINPDTDDEQANALTAIIGHSFDTLADEAARSDRPRRALVDDTFEALLGVTGATTYLCDDTNTGFLCSLRRELGLNSTGDSLLNPNLVTTEEAQLMGNMSLLEEYAVSLRDAYDRYFATPTGQDPRNGSFSGRVAYVSLLFSVVAHSVREVEEAMSAVNFSQPERRTTFIRDPNSTPTAPTPISVDSILQWIETLMVSTGPRLLADSGLIGLNHVLRTIDDHIEPLVDELLAISRGLATIYNTPPAPHPGMTHKRVRNALAQLASQIEQF